MMKIRKATKEDVPAIVEMLADDKLGVKRERYSIPLDKVYYQAFDKINADKNQFIAVLENEDKEVIGTLQLSFIQYLTYQGGTRSQIEAVRIRKDQRGKKLGERLFQWAIDKARNKGAHVLQLTTDKKRASAKSFYEKLGFVASHEGMKLHFPINELASD